MMKRSLAAAVMVLSVAFAAPLASAAPAGQRGPDAPAAGAPIVQVGGQYGDRDRDRYGQWKDAWKYNKKADRRHRKAQQKRWKQHKHQQNQYAYRHDDRRYYRPDNRRYDRRYDRRSYRHGDRRYNPRNHGGYSYGGYPPPYGGGYGYGYGKPYKNKHRDDAGAFVLGSMAAIGAVILLNELDHR